MVVEATLLLHADTLAVSFGLRDISDIAAARDIPYQALGKNIDWAADRLRWEVGTFLLLAEVLCRDMASDRFYFGIQFRGAADMGDIFPDRVWAQNFPKVSDILGDHTMASVDTAVRNLPGGEAQKIPAVKNLLERTPNGQIGQT